MNNTSKSRDICLTLTVFTSTIRSVNASQFCEYLHSSAAAYHGEPARNLNPTIVTYA